VSSNAQKTPIARTLPAFARRTARTEIATRFLELPGSVAAVQGGTVEIQFDDTTKPNAWMPVAGSKYARIPIQVGDAGVALASTAYLGAVSGLGTGTPAATALQPNLGSLIWVPLGNAGWTSVGEDQVMTDATGASVLTLSPTGITLAFGGKSVTINASGVTIDGLLFDTHIHTGVTTGSGVSGGPEAP